MSLFLALPLCALLAGPAPTPAPRLTLRDGRVFQLQAPPRTEGGRVLFTTTDGKAYSLDASEVQSFVSLPATPTHPPRTYNPQDSRDLGAIARQQRADAGKTTDLSSSSPSPRPTRTPKAAAAAPTSSGAAKKKAPRSTATPKPAA